MAVELNRRLQAVAQITSHLPGSREYHTKLGQVIQDGRASGFIPDFFEGRVASVDVPGLIGPDHPLVPLFTEGRAVAERLQLGGTPKDQFEGLLEGRGARIGDYARAMLRSDQFQTVAEPTMVLTARIQLKDLGATKNLNHQGVLKLGEDNKLTRLHPEAGGRHRLLHMEDQPNGDWVYIAMDTLLDADGDPGVFDVGRVGDARWLDDDWADPVYLWAS